jgi:hypothetical protein
MIEIVKRWMLQWVYGTVIAGIVIAILARIWPDAWWRLSNETYQSVFAVGAVWATFDWWWRRPSKT